MPWQKSGQTGPELMADDIWLTATTAALNNAGSVEMHAEKEWKIAEQRNGVLNVRLYVS